MKIVVSGSHGFIGSNLVTSFAGAHEFVKLNREDLQDKEKISAAFIGADIFIHLAGVSSISEVESDLLEAYFINVSLTCFLADLFYRTSPQGLMIFSSTGQVYDPEALQPLSEDSPTRPANAYARTKLAAEDALKIIAKSYAANLTILRFFNIAHKSQGTRFFLPSVYDQLISSSEKRMTVKVGNIDVYRDFTSISDVLRVFSHLFSQRECLKGVQLFNVCSGVPKKLRDLVLSLAEALGKEVLIEVDQARFRIESERHYGMSKLSDVLRSGDSQSIESFTRSFLR